MAKGRGGFGGGGMNMGNMVKQAQKMQKKMLETQNKLAQQEFIGTGGGGAVKVVSNGQQEVKKIYIDKEFIADNFDIETDKIDKDDLELFCDTILAAVKDSLKKASEKAENEMGSITGGLSIPGLF
jgi:DNA-binding YbaB/EbfC family protein